MADNNYFRSTGLTGFEPATSAVTGRCSNQLNYSPKLCKLLCVHKETFYRLLLVLQLRRYLSNLG